MTQGLNTDLHRSINERYEHCSAKPLPKMALNLTGKAGASELVGPWRVKRHYDPSGGPRLRPDDEHAGLSLRYLAARLANEFRAAFHEDNFSVSAEGIGRRDTRGHAR